MITYHNNGKIIQVTYSIEDINVDLSNKEAPYSINLPIINCKSKTDAIELQKTITAFIAEVIKNTI